MTRRALLLSPSFVFAQTAKAQGSLAQGVQADKPRWRDLAPGPGVYPTGPWNAITDVKGVRVGHSTLVEGARIRTGVTAILPHGGNLFQNKVAGNVFVANAFGKLAGSTQVQELGTIETPILLTNPRRGLGGGRPGALHPCPSGQRKCAERECFGRGN
ncbi:MAG: hypothetical protein OHK0021_02880 [Bryobacter sp.]